MIKGKAQIIVSAYSMQLVYMRSLTESDLCHKIICVVLEYSLKMSKKAKTGNDNMTQHHDSSQMSWLEDGVFSLCNHDKTKAMTCSTKCCN